MYRPRVLEKELKSYLSAFPAVGLTGPRQSGKSTLLQHCLGLDYRYVNFDDSGNVDAFNSDPAGFMKTYDNKVIFDEVQNVPDIFSRIKIEIDNDRQNYGKFILTGSSQFNLVSKITESLAGRIGLLSLLPYQYLEMPHNLRQASIYSGSYPELVERDYHASKAWYESYITTYLEKDVRNLINIGDVRDFHRFIQLLASQVSQQLNMSAIAADIGISVSTVKRWLSVLEASYIIYLLPPFYKNLGKRIVKSPKLYFYDTGVVSHLTKIQNEDQYLNGPLTGPLFENYVIMEIIKKNLHKKENSDFYYIRTSNGSEVDLIIDEGASQSYFEIKHNATFKASMAKHLRAIKSDNDQAFVLYNGSELENQGVKFLNYKDYLNN